MLIYSPIFNDLNCKEVENVHLNEIKYLYQNGYGLGLDLLSQFKNEEIKLFKCPISNFQFYYPSNLEGNSNYYEQLENRNINYYNSDSWEFKVASRMIGDNEKVLEIGSGNLSFLNLIKNKANIAVGLELNEESVRKGISNGLQIYNSTIQEYSINNKNEFDVVCAFQVLEHINFTELESFIGSSLDSLKKSGKLIFAVPNNKSIVFKDRRILKHYSSKENFKLHCTTIALNLPPHHMGLWDLKSLKSLAKKYPIKIRSVHFEPLNKFRYGLVRDILISRLSKYFGYSLSKFIASKFFSNKFLKKYFKGDSILIEFEKIN